MPTKKQLHLDLPEDLHSALGERASREQRSLGAEVRVAITRHLTPDSAADEQPDVERQPVSGVRER